MNYPSVKKRPAVLGMFAKFAVHENEQSCLWLDKNSITSYAAVLKLDTLIPAAPIQNMT